MTPGDWNETDHYTDKNDFCEFEHLLEIFGMMRMHKLMKSVELDKMFLEVLMQKWQS